MRQWMLGGPHSVMPIDKMRTDGWCPTCQVSSLWRMYFATYERNTPVGVVRTVEYCFDCGNVADG